MERTGREEAPPRKDERVIIHFDHDCFYAAVFEAENPALKSLPLAVQQKHIIVTCNYEARRRGLYKLQLITEAKRLCPEVIIVLGEDISRFRDASKDLYNFLAPFSWSRRVERLGFDEVWFDVTDVVDYNMSLLNRNQLEQSFFQLSKDDPTSGFSFDAGHFAGHTCPPDPIAAAQAFEFDPELTMRLLLGSHLAIHMRHTLAGEKGYTSTVGISTNKLLSKLVGNMNKPNGQTTLLPPYGPSATAEGNASLFLDPHDIGKIPSIGFKTAQKLRAHVLQREAAFDFGLVYGGTRESVTVRDVRLHPDINPERLEKMLSGPGSPHGIGPKVWALLHGIDDSEVGRARQTPRQISIEDSYIRLDTIAEVQKELLMLAKSLLNRMRIDLVGFADDDEPTPKDTEDPATVTDTEESAHKNGSIAREKKWLAHPRTLRLSTRPKPPVNADGTRTRSFKRISHSAPLPNFVFSLTEHVDSLAEKLVREALIPMFRKLHTEKSGWNLSLVNIAVTNMIEAGGEGRDAGGRDIGRMFKRQDEVLRDFRVVDDGHHEPSLGLIESAGPAEDQADTDPERRWKGKARQAEATETGEPTTHQYQRVEGDNDHDEDDEAEDAIEQALASAPCKVCGALLPPFALPAHERFHELGD